MSAIDTRQPGFLTVLSEENTCDVNDTLREFVSGITGIPLTIVRRRWLQKPGKRPSNDTDWCAVGVTETVTHGTPFFEGHKGVIDQPESGDTKQSNHQTLSCTASFYGPNAERLSEIFRSGCTLGQNNSWLNSHGLTMQWVELKTTHSPDFVFEQWIDRFDVVFKIGRKISRTYGIRTIASADFNLITEKGEL